MNIQWYPGHMTKAFRQMQEDIKLIDLCIEIVDARIPLSSRNPDIDRLCANKARLILLNKADLADEAITSDWIRFYEEQGIEALALDSRSRKNMGKVSAAVERACALKRQKDAKRGIKNRPLRTLVAGIPNVGKSTFINSFAGKACTKTGNKPGVTKGKQWIRLNKQLELLDTPGVLWPKFDDQTVGLHLAFIGSINDQIIELRELSFKLIEEVKLYAPGVISAKYGIDESPEDAYDIIKAIAANRNCLKKGEELDTDRACGILIDDFRSGNLGRISLERPIFDGK